MTFLGVFSPVLGYVRVSFVSETDRRHGVESLHNPVGADP